MHKNLDEAHRCKLFWLLWCFLCGVFFFNFSLQYMNMWLIIVSKYCTPICKTNKDWLANIILAWQVVYKYIMVIHNFIEFEKNGVEVWFMVNSIVRDHLKNSKFWLLHNTYSFRSLLPSKNVHITIFFKTDNLYKLN